MGVLLLTIMTNGGCVFPLNSAQSSTMMELTTELSPVTSPTYKPKCVPSPITEPNVEEFKKIPRLEVPRGTYNLAKGKTVTASESLGALELVTDGNKEENCYAELFPGLQWIQIDLQNEATIYAVWVWHYYKGWDYGWKSCYLDVIVQLSDEPTFTGKVTTIFNNDYDNSAGKGIGKDRPYIETNLGKLIPVQPPTKGRYVRLYSSGNCGGVVPGSSRYVEVEVFGVDSRVHTGLK